MIERIDDFPAPDRPISSTLRCLWRFPRSSVLIAAELNRVYVHVCRGDVEFALSLAH
jgi:hypothetical protein